MNKVSVIVPVYNTEDYLPKCLDSLVGQILQDIEIICVDDGSTDKSIDVIRKYQDNDSRVKLLTQQHSRQGAARNLGTKFAKSEYIGFVDSDDWVDKDYFEKLYYAAKKFDSDIALATNVRIGNGKTKKRLDISEEIFVTALAEKFEICKHWQNECPTNKIYRRDFLLSNNIVWPEDIFCEDKPFTTEAVYFANGIVTVPGVHYYYYRNPHSTVNKKTKEHLAKLKNDKDAAKSLAIKFLRDKNAEFADKKYWTTIKEISFMRIPLLLIKESVKTRRFYLFSFIKLFEYTVKTP